MKLVDMTFMVDPVACERPRVTRNGTYTPAKTQNFKKALRLLAMKHKPKPAEGPLYITLYFSLKRPKSVKRPFPSVRPDLDNYVKAVKDAFNGVFWIDDGQVINIEASKRYGAVPFVKIEVFEAVET